MKRPLISVLVLSAFTAAATVTTAKFLEPMEVGKPTPFTIEMVTEIYDLNGAQHATVPFTVAYANDGSNVRIDYFETESGEAVERRRIYDLDGGYKYVTFGESVSSYSLSSARVDAIRNEKFKCGNFLSQKKELFGFEVVLEVEDISALYPNLKSARRESWHAPDLGCTALRVEVTVTESDGTTRVVSGLSAKKVTVGAPDRSLFVVPDYYVERTPSGAINHVRESYDIDLPVEGADDFLWRLDEAYWTNLLVL